MAFHVEIRRGLRRASEFNLDEARLRRAVVEPWNRGRPVRLGDQDWDPSKSRLTVLEGPELTAPDLAHGQGWNNAQREARDVSGRLLTPTPGTGDPGTVALLADTPATKRAGTELLSALGLRPVDWAAVRARISTDGPGVAAAVLLVEGSEPPRSWLLEAGVALGALGAGAVLAQLGTEPPPPELQDLAVVRLEPGQAGSLDTLAERLRRAGCRVGPIPD